jgi:uncharacterized protein
MPKRTLFALFALASCTALTAASSVWKITKGDRTLYLGGTCHILRASDFPLPPEFDAAFAASEVVVFETDIARATGPEMQEIVVTRGVFTDGRTLVDVLTPEAWQLVEQYCKRAGLPVAQFAGLKPWLFTLAVSMSELQKAGVTQEGVDLHYHKRAGAAGKRTGHLESLEQQVDFIVNLGAGYESEMIIHTIEDLAQLPQMLDDLLGAWKTGDEKAIDQAMLQSMRERYPVIFRELVVSRNEAWLPKLDALLETPEVEFVLVGVGHVAGPEGLLARLRERDYLVAQIDVTASAAATTSAE